jgi:hypothetical protein
MAHRTCGHQYIEPILVALSPLGNIQNRVDVMNLDAVHFDWFWRKFWHDSTEGRLRHSPGTRLKPGTRRSGLLDSSVCPTTEPS